MNLAQLLVRAARLHPDKPALVLGTRPLASFAQTADRVARLAQAMCRRLGLREGDCVALAMRNTPAFVEVLFATWHAGLIVVPVNAHLHPKEIAYILGHSGAKVCFSTASEAAAIASYRGAIEGLQRIISVDDRGYEVLMDGDAMAPARRAPADAAWLFYTSGTTGKPKGAELSHRSLLTMSLGYFADHDPVAAGDSILHIAPMCHGSGLYIVPHIAAAAAQVVPESRGFDPEEVFRLIAAHRGVSLFGAPTIVRRLSEHPAAGNADTRNLKLMIYGGAPMYTEDLKRALERFGPKFAQIYGQGESPMAITFLPRAMHADPSFESKLGTVGIPQSVVEVMVADGEDRPLPAGETGEVLVRGDTVMNGYWRNPEATAASLRGGWLHTGDVGSFDGDGFLTLKDRSKDVIISGGANIYPREIEEVLLRHPAVSEVSVIGRRDADWGEVVVAVVARRAGSTVSEEELDALCLQSVARFKRPKVYRFVDNLPKSTLGKILKTEVRAIVNAPDAPPGVAGRD